MLSLTTPDLLIWGGGLFVVWYILSSIAACCRLRHIPGPFLARFSYFPHLYNILAGQFKVAYEDIHNKYANGGPFIRIAPTLVVTNDPDVLRHIGAARSTWGRHEWYQAARFHHEYESTACIIDTEAHDRAKAKTASGYNGREVGAKLEPAIDAVIASLAHLIRRKHLSTGTKGNPVDISSLLRLFTVDVITRLGYGKAFGHLDDGVDLYGFLAEVSTSYRLSSLLLDIPALRRIVFSRIGLLSLLGPRETDKSGVGRIMGVIHDLISERFKQDVKTTRWNDMIGGFIRNGLTQREVEGEANLQIFAGSETTATALAATLMYLATSPRAYSHLKHEIRDSISRGHVSADAPITLEQAQKLPYLQAVIWEGFRMCSPVNMGHYKVAPAGGDTVAGTFLPAGTAVGHNSLALTRNTAVFGHSPHVFRPERFLEPECGEETRVHRLRSLDIIFGGGRWACSGKTVALFELNKVTFELMRAFDFQVVNPRNAWHEKHYVMPAVSNMMVQITEADPGV
ncbi:cytochrome P450 [Lasiosphaeria hispida]|uniref:Cytochrome P450 n=1 Tax=Lasiosphaeria hispida TaxID=260671 RepID=A0AAJ0HT10_9PEZI|nr:cytochrome P450 [Lasiosphaeria hispida]